MNQQNMLTFNFSASSNIICTLYYTTVLFKLTVTVTDKSQL